MVGDPFEHPGFLSVYGCRPVAFAAIHRLVLTQQPECCIVVVESGSRTEPVVTMAIAACLTEGSLVVVLMAGCACLPQTQVSACPFP